MKKIFFMLSVICMAACSSSHPVLEDGSYLVKQLGTDTTLFIVNEEEEALINFNPEFVDTVGDPTKVLVYTKEFVPIELENPPQLLPHTAEKKKLRLLLSSEAAEKLEDFTARNIMKKVVLVVGGEALSVHKIRDTIRGGHLEITRCGDNACEKLEVLLKDNVKK